MVFLCCTILLQDRGDVTQIIEDREDTREWYDSIIDHYIEDVELTRFHLQVAP